MTPLQAVPEPEGLRRLLDGLPAGGTVLDLGSAPEWDADGTGDDLGGPYDAVVALAVLQHVDRAVVPDLLGRVADALEPGGAFLVSVREGDGEQREVSDSGSHRAAVLWREPDLCDALEDAGFALVWRGWGEDSEEHRWLTFLARARAKP